MNSINKSIEKSNRKWVYSYYEILCAMYMMHKILPAVGVMMPSVIYMLIFGIVFIMSVNRITSSIGNASIFKLLPIMCISALYMIRYLLSFDISGMSLYVYGELQILLYGLIALAFVSSFDLYSQNRFLNFLILCYVVTAISTIIGCSLYPNAARVLATASISNSEYIMYLKYNIGGFSFIYEITLLSPIIIYLINSKRIGRILGTIVLIVFGVAIVKSEYTTALIIYSISLVLYFFRNWNRKKLAIFFSITVTLIISRTFLIDAFSWLSANINSGTLASRFNDVAGILNGVDTSQLGPGGSRLRLYQQSWETIFSTNLLGAWNSVNVGGHSFILDNMGMFGVLGLLFLIISFLSSWKYAVKQYKQMDVYYYFVYVYVLIIIMAFINPKFNIYMFICIFPLIGCTSSQTE